MIEENQIEHNEVVRENKRTSNNSCYVAHIYELIIIKPTNIEEELSCQTYKDAMIE